MTEAAPAQGQAAPESARHPTRAGSAGRRALLYPGRPQQDSRKRKARGPLIRAPGDSGGAVRLRRRRPSRAQGNPRGVPGRRDGARRRRSGEDEERAPEGSEGSTAEVERPSESALQTYLEAGAGRLARARHNAPDSMSAPTSSLTSAEHATPSRAIRARSAALHWGRLISRSGKQRQTEKCRYQPGQTSSSRS